jgi:hypothetical protein
MSMYTETRAHGAGAGAVNGAAIVACDLVRELPERLQTSSQYALANNGTTKYLAFWSIVSGGARAAAILLTSALV